jgi:hypothetical protein
MLTYYLDIVTCTYCSEHKEEIKEMVRYIFGSITISDPCFSECCMLSKML